MEFQDSNPGAHQIPILSDGELNTSEQQQKSSQYAKQLHDAVPDISEQDTESFSGFEFQLSFMCTPLVKPLSVFNAGLIVVLFAASYKLWTSDSKHVVVGISPDREINVKDSIAFLQEQQQSRVTVSPAPPWPQESQPERGALPGPRHQLQPHQPAAEPRAGSARPPGSSFTGKVKTYEEPLEAKNLTAWLERKHREELRKKQQELAKQHAEQLRRQQEEAERQRRQQQLQQRRREQAARQRQQQEAKRRRAEQAALAERERQAAERQRRVHELQRRKDAQVARARAEDAASKRAQREAEEQRSRQEAERRARHDQYLRRKAQREALAREQERQRAQKEAEEKEEQEKLRKILLQQCNRKKAERLQQQRKKQQAKQQLEAILLQQQQEYQKMLQAAREARYKELKNKNQRNTGKPHPAINLAEFYQFDGYVNPIPWQT
ncbi:trichohyalin-like [Schistocerca cancellata]|uniref:trichohyalin-like n=1 Tax=Schistocerca cancellata TaxID=274614 RepID=UPI002117BA2C|nr:trichohyalin-like [Schistocerca cancellata]